MNHWILVGIGVASTLLGMLSILKLFPKIGLLDRPQDYGLSRAPVPYPAGVIIFIVFTVLLLSVFPVSTEHLGLTIAGLVLVAYSFWDDRKRLKAKYKIALHLLVAFIVVFSGIGIEVISSPFGGVINLQAISISFELLGNVYTWTPVADIVTIAWIFIVMNAVNLLDGIPGLVSGVGALSSFTLYALSMLLVFAATTTMLEKEAALQVAEMALILGSILLVFNRFDFPSPKVIIGDAGAMYIGFLLSILAIISGGKVATTLIVLGLPLADMIWVAVRRISKGQSPVSADRNHYHHKLLRLGFTEKQALYLLYSLSAVLGVTSIMLLFYFQTTGKVIAFVSVIILIFITSLLLIKKEEHEQRGF